MIALIAKEIEYFAKRAVLELGNMALLTEKAKRKKPIDGTVEMIKIRRNKGIELPLFYLTKSSTLHQKYSNR